MDTVSQLDPAAGSGASENGTGSRRLRVLTVVDHYLPGFRAGGPIRSIDNLVACLGDRIQFDVVTADVDLGQSEPYPNIEAGCWQALEHARVRYMSRRERSLAGWRSLLAQDAWDLLYLNSVFSRTAIRILALRRMGLVPRIPVVIAPRGEVHPGALSVHRRRKVAWLAFCHRAGLYGGLEWQAATGAEREDICRVFPEAARRVHLARQVPLKGVAAGAAAASLVGGVVPPLQKAPGSARLVFISRISPKKNLDYALRVVAGAGRDVEFDIYGPVETEKYWRACRAVLPASVKVRYCGALRQDQVVPTFARYHLFVFPTRGESFGHVVLESLVAGCPVLVSDQTPWRNLAGRSAGWDVPLSEPESFASCIRSIVEMDQASFDRWRAGARSLGRSWASDDTGMEAHRRMFFAVAQAGEPSPGAGVPVRRRPDWSTTGRQV